MPMRAGNDRMLWADYRRFASKAITESVIYGVLFADALTTSQDRIKMHHNIYLNYFR